MPRGNIGSSRTPRSVEPGRVYPATVPAVPFLHRIGWILFTASAVVFLVVGIRDGDALTIGAGILFTLGCLMFLLPER